MHPIVHIRRQQQQPYRHIIIQISLTTIIRHIIRMTGRHTTALRRITFLDQATRHI